MLKKPVRYGKSARNWLVWPKDHFVSGKCTSSFQENLEFRFVGLDACILAAAL